MIAASADNWIGLGLGVLLTIYLVVVLVGPGGNPAWGCQVKTHRKLSALVVAGLWLAACGDDDEESSSSDAAGTAATAAEATTDDTDAAPPDTEADATAATTAGSDTTAAEGDGGGGGDLEMWERSGGNAPMVDALVAAWNEANPDARKRGIETVYQDLALINDLPVFLNMSLKRELTRGRTPFLDKRAMRALARGRLSEMAIRIPSVDTDVALLSGGQRQAIAVARAVFTDAKVILLDEPLAAMGRQGEHRHPRRDPRAQAAR